MIGRFSGHSETATWGKSCSMYLLRSGTDMTFWLVQAFSQVYPISCHLDWRSCDPHKKHLSIQGTFDTRNTTVSDKMRIAQADSPKKAPSPLKSIHTGDKLSSLLFSKLDIRVETMDDIGSRGAYVGHRRNGTGRVWQEHISP